MSTQGVDNLVVVDNMPAVTKLWNGRFRLEFFCSPSNKNEGWYSDNIALWLPEFGALQDADFTDSGWAALDGETYPNIRLIEAAVPYIAPSESHIVTLTYETLTDTLEQEIDDAIDYELNGLRRATRTLIAKEGVDYQKVIGVNTISSQIDAETPVTLFLAGYEIEDNDAFRRVVEVWMEAGTLSVTKKNLSEGVIEVSTAFFGVEGATVGPVISRGIGDFQGLQTINVTTLQDVDGNSVVDGGENLVNQVSGISSFTYPGIMEVSYLSPDLTIRNIQTLLKKSPAQTRVKTTTYFIFQTSNSLVDSDFTYLAATGLWSPNHWASISASAEGSNSGSEWNDSATFRGYRTSSVSKSETFSGPGLSNAVLRWQGGTVIIDGASITYDSVVDQGPPDPIGGVFTLDVQITPAFDDLDGNKYYKKTIVVTDVIPTQPLTASLPYT